jgi:hypothetical protein
VEDFDDRGIMTNIRPLLITGALGIALLGAACSTAAPATTSPVVVTNTAQPPAGPSSAVATPAADPQPASGSGGVPRCVTGDLKGSFGTGDAGAGSQFLPLMLTNTTSRTCELVGYPGVSYVTGDDGHQVGPAAAMDGPRNPQVDLSAGKAAVAQLRLVNVANFDAGACKPVAVRGVRVYPPGDTASLFVPFATDQQMGCQGTPPGDQLFVQSVKPA